MTLNELFARSDRYDLVVMVTPAMAEDWLSHCNTHNRKLIDTHVDYLTREMKAGRWQLTHQGIAFSDKRVLLDGQHRLWAIVLSEVAVPMRIFVNEPAEGMEVLDTGHRRTNDQLLSLAGGLGQVSKHELAALRALVGGMGRYTRRSAGAERDLLIRHREAIRFAMECTSGTRKYRGVGTAITRAVLARAWYSADHARLRYFADVLQSGTPLGEHDQPIMLLFQFLVTSGVGHKSSPQVRDCYGRTERALAAFLKGERCNKLHATSKELFPLPNERETAAA